jgi:hypothetical protein
MISKQVRRFAMPFLAIAWQACVPVLAQEGARDMFYQELKKPSAAPSAFSAPSPVHTAHASVSHGFTGSRTGLSFYIKLTRNGRTTLVDSRTKFRANDQVRFVITPTIDGYASIVLLQGSSGKSAVLFPDPQYDKSNHVSRGVEVSIPARQAAALAFDNTPGREHIRIALTRSNVDAASFASPQAPSKLAMANISANPAIDPTNGHNEVKVSFKEDIPKPKPQPVVHQAPASAPVQMPTNTEAIQNAIPDEDMGKDMYRDASSAGSGGGGTHHSVAARRPARRPTYHPTFTSSPPPPPSTVVMNANANEDLYADITLEHE